jgi:hypothetical protein
VAHDGSEGSLAIAVFVSVEQSQVNRGRHRLVAGVIGMQVIAAVVGRLSLAYEESAKSSYSDADGERRNKTNPLSETVSLPR